MIGLLRAGRLRDRAAVFFVPIATALATVYRPSASAAALSAWPHAAKSGARRPGRANREERRA